MTDSGELCDPEQLAQRSLVDVVRASLRILGGQQQSRTGIGGACAPAREILRCAHYDAKK
jgi:hypothetical protein